MVSSDVTVDNFLNIFTANMNLDVFSLPLSVCLRYQSENTNAVFLL